MKHPGVMKKPVSFFLVEHEQGDIFGLLLAWCCYSPSFIIAIQSSVLVTLLLQSRTTVSGRSGKPSQAIKLSAMLLLGQLLNEALNLVLKNMIKQERPTSNHGFNDYGMPSSHSQFMAFLAVSFPVLAKEVILATDLPYPRLLCVFLKLACYAGTFAVAFARFYLKYHTIEQVLAGLLLGYVLGVIWKQRYLSIKLKQ